MHSTFGSRSSNLGGLCREVSTGTDFGSLSRAGVPVPGVEGGVKAGLMRVPGSGDAGLSLRSYWAIDLVGSG